MNLLFNPADYIKCDKEVRKMVKENNGKKSKEITTFQLNQRGIGFDKNGKPLIDSNQFIKYSFTRITARENTEGYWFYNYKAKHYDLISIERAKKIFFHIIEEASESIWKVSMEKQYISYFKNKVQQFDTSGDEPGILQFDNCILDFSNLNEPGTYEPSSDFFCNFRLPYDFDENAECPKFVEFLNDIFEDDNERVMLIQEIMGACLYYEKCIQSLIVFLGNGSNGKSLLASVIKHMLGDSNVSAIALDRLSGERFAKQNLDRKLLNISSETKVEKVYSTSDLKCLTGGDSVEVEKKFKDSYTTEIHCKYFLLANDMIQTEDYSDGFYRRLIIIPFNKHYYDSVPNEEKDENKQYKNPYLEGELIEELPGIFNFAFEGLLRLWENDFNFTFSEECEKAKKKYRNEHNIVKAFLTECADFSEGYKVKSSDLFPRFQRFCKENHYIRQYNNMTKNRFFKLFNQMINEGELAISKKKRRDAEYFIGIQLK